MLTIFLARTLACLNPSLYSNTSAIISLSGTDIAIGLKRAFRLSGNFDLPPYPLPIDKYITCWVEGHKNACIFIHFDELA